MDYMNSFCWAMSINSLSKNCSSLRCNGKYIILTLANISKLLDQISVSYQSYLLTGRHFFQLIRENNYLRLSNGRYGGFSIEDFEERAKKQKAWRSEGASSIPLRVKTWIICRHLFDCVYMKILVLAGSFSTLLAKTWGVPFCWQMR